MFELLVGIAPPGQKEYCKLETGHAMPQFPFTVFGVAVVPDP